jgi:hypothetical protein
MKIAKIEHTRCGQYRATTYMWLDDTVTETQLESIVDKASDAYLAALDAYKNDPTAPPNPGYSPTYEKYGDLTVGEIKTIFEGERAKYQAWEDKKNAARRPFGEFLITAGAGLVQSFYQGTKDAMTARLSWGHRHGEILEFEEIHPESQDFNVPQPQSGEDWL